MSEWVELADGANAALEVGVGAAAVGVASLAEGGGRAPSAARDPLLPTTTPRSDAAKRARRRLQSHLRG